MQKSSAPDTSLDIDRYELRRKVRKMTQKKKKITDSPTSDRLAKFVCHPLKNIQHLLFALLML